MIIFGIFQIPMIMLSAQYKISMAKRSHPQKSTPNMGSVFATRSATSERYFEKDPVIPV
jgi:hypothetical protein